MYLIVQVRRLEKQIRQKRWLETRAKFYAVALSHCLIIVIKKLSIIRTKQASFEEKKKASFCAVTCVNVNVKAFKVNNITES